MSVHIEERDDALWATIDRPDALNAVDYEVMEGLESAIDRLESESQWRAFVLTGAGEKCFVSGGDLKKFADLTTAEQAAEMAGRMKAILARLEALDCWTIACINGDAYGGGCETLLAFDFRVAAEGARFGLTQANFHVTPGWGGLTRLVEAIGRRQALRWLGEATVVDAERALQAGLIDRVVPRAALEQSVISLIERLAEQDRELIGALKHGAMRARDMGRTEAIEAELEPFCDLWAGDEHARRVETFLSRKDDE
jgi:enoyl-CoA hydratase/carnithine racemase